MPTESYIAMETQSAFLLFTSNIKNNFTISRKMQCNKTIIFFSLEISTKEIEDEDFRYMKIHIFALRWKDEIRKSSQLRTLLKRVVVNRT